MEYRHEVIGFGESVPVRCFVHRLGHSDRHWHNSIELLFALQGSVKIIVAGATYVLDPDDVLLINSNEPHELSAEDCILAAIQIKLSLFDEKVLRDSNLYFDCYSKSRPNDPGIVKIKQIVAQFVKNYATNDESRLLRAKSLSYALLSELTSYFKVERTEAERDQTRYHYERITRIVNYINEHYNENISLQSIAEHEYLSVPYLSKFFMRMMGVNFYNYLQQLRLTHAVTDLNYTSNTIEAIAEQNGFSNSQAFVQLFKKKYGMLPSQYRREHPVEEAPSAAKNSFNEYIILDSHRYLNHFAAYLTDERVLEEREDNVLPTVSSHYTMDGAAVGTKLMHTWRGFTSVGSAKELLFKEVQEMLRCLQRDVGFSYIKFHGILSDDMRVFARGRDGEVQYSFVYVDEALDFLMSIGLKPLIQFSFMPRDMAQDPEHMIFESTMINSPPKEIGDWCALVDALMKHLMRRYGVTEVSSWLFTVWNEPDTPESMFGFPSEGMFYDFYKATYDTLKAIEPTLQMGTPSTYFDPKEKGMWLRRFTDWCSRNNCLPDCVFFHYYGTNITYTTVVEHGYELNLGQIQLTTDENMLKKSIDMIRSFVRTSYPKETPVYLTEWNYSPSHRDLLGDTCFRSCYIVKNILENYDRLDSFGYWLLTDLFEERQVPMEVFHGGLGLFTYNGIKKAVYYAFYLLAKLGDTLIDSGDGYFLTRQDDGYQLMLYHYRHYSQLYAEWETFDMTFTDRYTPFEPENKRDFEIRIENVPEGVWRITEYAINRQSGSSFDKWVEMGAQPIESKEEVELLRSLSLPMINKYTTLSDVRGLKLNALLDLLEVRLILIRPQTP